MKKLKITKRQAVKWFGSQAKLARALGISRAAVFNWADDEPIPQLRAMTIRYELKPELWAKKRK